MMSTALARRLATGKIHYGWVVLAATFLTMLVVAGAVGAPGVFIVPLQREFGWTAADISAALAIRFLLFGLIGPFAAAFMNRFGVRRMMLISLGIVTIGLLLSLGMSQLWQLVLLWGVVIGLGTGLTAMVLGATVATRWFSDRRGLVMGLLSASTATGQLAFLPLLAGMTDTFGWRSAVLLVCGAILLAALVVLLLMRDRPSDLGLPPYGDSAIQPPPVQTIGFGALLMTPITVLRDAAKVPTFWFLFLSFYICGASTNGLVQTHFIALCGDYGLAAVGAASMLAMMGLFDFGGTLASGWLSDRFDNRWLLFWYYGLRGASLLYLPFSDFSLYSLSLFAVFYGLDWVATVPPTVKLTAQRFGPERANIVFGWIFAGHQLGAASAAMAGGLSRTVWHSYMPAFVAAGLLCLIGAGLVLMINRGRPAILQGA
ncbi:MAG: MFS transporter [Sphingobium sp.]|uniref:MFS transporter n=1 Tax=Sphingobium sp. TaxID=1912891 RepID=UPI000C4488D5|nr:MFS transporter [Sphingobium sp.]MBU0658656.1 MFS transporter [Alphaproteobacteria bacterium]MBA4754906.1 MFS transporter [Sphingobium sp.]MBS87208.1 MFS transporter [Sphingobium sp.]MBU0776059.1 MFS transporter [Alphaproteobacteria bacterium]MBU1463955.1 MFS transporter [Alphaproteobacteria bacterium]